MEVGVVLLLFVLPTLHSLALGIPIPPSETAADEIYGWILDLGTISLLVYLLWRDRRTPVAIGLVGTPWKELVYGSLIFLVSYVAGFGALLTGVEWFGLGELPAATAGAPPAYLLPVSLILSAAAEEVLFRCYLWVRLVDLSGRPALSLIVSNLLFAAVHGYGAAGSLSVFVSGCVWGLFYWATGRLPRLVVAHWAGNMVRAFGLS